MRLHTHSAFMHVPEPAAVARTGMRHTPDVPHECGNSRREKYVPTRLSTCVESRCEGIALGCQSPRISNEQAPGVLRHPIGPVLSTLPAT